MVALFAATSGSLRAQSGMPAPTPTPIPAPPKKPFGHIRFLNMRGDKTELLQLINPAASKDTPMAVGSPLNFSADYVKLPSGSYNLQVVRATDKATPLKIVPPILLKPETFMSILVREDAGQIGVEVIDDSYELDKTPTGTLTVRDFWPGAEVTITVPAIPSATATVAEGKVATIEGLPTKIVPLYMKARQPNGAIKTWNTEADFTKGKRRATLFIIGDRYNRFRPCIAEDARPGDPADAPKSR